MSNINHQKLPGTRKLWRVWVYLEMGDGRWEWTHSIRMNESMANRHMCDHLAHGRKAEVRPDSEAIDRYFAELEQKKAAS